MSDRRRDKTYELPRSSRDELIASQRRLASKQHMTLPHGVSPEPDHPTGAVAPELSDGLHVPERAPIAAAEIHQAIGAHIDLIPDDERDKLLLALGARKYALAASIADAEVKRYPKNLSLSRAASAVRHYAIGRAEADLGALFIAPRMRRPAPTGLSPDVAAAVRLVDGKTPIESIIRQTKVERLKALDTFALLARTGFMELPRVATPAPSDLVLAPSAIGPSDRPRAASSDSVSPAAARAPRSESGVRRSDRPAAISEPGLPAVPDVSPASTPAPAGVGASPAAAVRDAAAILELMLPDLDVAPPKRAISVTELPAVTPPSSRAPTSAAASEPAPISSQPARRLTEAEVAAKVRELVPGPLEIDTAPLSSRRPEAAPVSVSSSPTGPGSSPTPDAPSPRTPHSGVALGMRPSFRPRSASRLPWVVGALALGIAGAGLFVYRSVTGSATTSPASSALLAATPPSVAAAPPRAMTTSVIPEPAMDTITVDIWVEPKYARVYLDGVLFTESPIHVSIPRSDKTHEVKAEAPGYRPRVSTFGGKENTNLVISLERVPRRTP